MSVDKIIINSEKRRRENNNLVESICHKGNSTREWRNFSTDVDILMVELFRNN